MNDQSQSLGREVATSVGKAGVDQQRVGLLERFWGDPGLFGLEVVPGEVERLILGPGAPHNGSELAGRGVALIVWELGRPEQGAVVWRHASDQVEAEARPPPISSMVLASCARKIGARP